MSIAEPPFDPPPHPALIRARRWARLLDDRFSLFGLRFGLDGVLGLIPGVGALVTLAGGAVMLSSANALGLSASVKARIVGYAAFDLVIGVVPVLGDVADLVFKSHLRSLKTIERAVARQARD